MLRHGGRDLQRLEHLREERLIHQHALQDAEQRAVAAAEDELVARTEAEAEKARVREIGVQIDDLLDGMPRREKQ